MAQLLFSASSWLVRHTIKNHPSVWKRVSVYFSAFAFHLSSISCICLHDNFKNCRYLSFSATGLCRRRSKIKNDAFEPGRAAANANPSNPFLVNSFECPFVFCRPCLSLHRRCCLLPPSVKQYFPVESQRSVTVFFRPINVTMQSSGVAPFARATQKV